MLPAPHRLRHRTQITSTVKGGARASRGGVVVHIVVNSGADAHEPSRAAFAVSRAVGGSATRHRVTRRLRAVTHPLLHRLPPGTALVVRALPAAADAASVRLAADLEAALGSALRRQGCELTPPADANEGKNELPISVIDEPDAKASTGRTGLARALWIVETPLRWLLIGVVGLYRLTISPLLPPTCRFHPSCSAYGLESLKVHGAAKGTLLTAWRVLRCNPWNLGGLDPVPPRGAWRPEINPDGTPRTPAAAESEATHLRWRVSESSADSRRMPADT